MKISRRELLTTFLGAPSAFAACRNVPSRFPAGASPYTVNDRGGNGWQGTSSAFGEYPYIANDGREDQTTSAERVIRGSMFAFGSAISRTNVRNKLEPNDKAISVGFRCAV